MLYARAAGSVAAPTAGLHFDDEMLRTLAETRTDVEMVRLTLHVGAGTFAPLEGDAVADHAMHAMRHAFDVGDTTLIKALSEWFLRNL